MDTETRKSLKRMILQLLHSRSGSMCPSEAPRRLRPGNWRCAWRARSIAHRKLTAFWAAGPLWRRRELRHASLPTKALYT